MRTFPGRICLLSGFEAGVKMFFHSTAMYDFRISFVLFWIQILRAANQSWILTKMSVLVIPKGILKNPIRSSIIFIRETGLEPRGDNS